MHRELCVARRAHDTVKRRHTEHTTAGGIVGILDRQGADARYVRRRGAYGTAHQVRGEQPVRRRDGSDLRTGQHGDSGELIVHQVRVRFEYDFCPLLCEQPDSCLVGLSPRRKEQRVLGTEELGDALLEPARRRVAIQHVVADFRVRHRAPHSGGRLGDRIRPQIDGVHPSRTRCRRRIRIRSYVSATSPPSRNT